ncbi:MAG: ctaB [Parcubacteria group bacterium]|nr:ctaB [Parcubacteria group bacterium]
MLKDYYRLAKPGIVYGNIFTTIAGFLFAAHWIFDRHSALIALATFTGLGLVIASAAVFNNYLDRDMDAKMERTSARVLVTGAIAPRNALIYGSILGIIGFALLYFFVNLLSTEIALFGFIFYAVIYTYAKRKTDWAAVIGSVPGAVPIVVGYTAVMNHLDIPALCLFVAMVAWQMPHFYAIAIYRMNEYAAAGIPVLPAKKGIPVAKKHIFFYILAFILATAAFFIFHYAGYTYLAIVFAAGFAWLWRSIRGFETHDDVLWARGLFRYSLVVLLAFSVAIAIGPVLP